MRSSYYKVFAISMLVLILAAGCGPSNEVVPDGDLDLQIDSKASEIMIDSDDRDSQIDMTMGQVLIVSLPSNPTTGFQWEVAEIDGVVLQQGEATDYEASQPVLEGSGGVETFYFEAKSAGQITLKLIYHRSWEEGVDPVDEFSVSVVVQ
ncbi:MAG: protease inhibitor I42 family protein [Chloroflexi bacterium]|nr:protease inhibitor I42 family protein [Chloroflexota bacterium]MBU1662710.1 protease inhibitor I42 family protein [Chloroflexota bacterium]